MVHPAASGRDDQDQCLLDDGVQHVDGRRRYRRGHRSDSRRLGGRCRAAAKTGLQTLLQHDHRPGDHRRRWLHPPGPQHVDIRRDLLSEGPRQEESSDGLRPERARVPTDDDQVLDENTGEPQTVPRTPTVLHNPSEKSLYPGTPTDVPVSIARRRRTTEKRTETQPRELQHRAQGSDTTETTHENDQLAQHHEHHQETCADTGDIRIALGVAPRGQREN